MNFTFKVIKNGWVIERVKTHSNRRFLNRIGTINWRNNPLKVYLRVNYGKMMCNQGCVCSFYNDGWYENKEDFWLAFQAFKEGGD